MAVKSFPFEIFHPDVACSFRDMAQEYSIPIEYFGTTALFTIAALSGNMYQTELNGSIKNIMFCMLVGPSGTGKTPAYDLLCGNIVESLNASLWRDYETAHREWREKRDACKVTKTIFNDVEPVRRVRMATGGTAEGFMRHAMTSPAGFGIYYDEGGQMLGSPNQYKKENSSVDFWNRMWNGQPYEEVRADGTRERYVDKTSISVLMGMQGDRLQKYFGKDVIDSGLPFRYLMCMADEMPLNENVDWFRKDRRQPDLMWRNLVTNLFWKGARDHFKDDAPTVIPFTPAARVLFNDISAKYLRRSNILKTAKLRGDNSEVMGMMESKLYAYFGRFLIVLAIMDNMHEPVITETTVFNSSQLYEYFRFQAEMIFGGMEDDDLSENERLLLDSLPDIEFGRDEILLSLTALKLSDKFFDTAYRRKYRSGFLKKVGRGRYLKDN